MEKEEIVNGSKLIAKYLGWKYVPSNKLEGFPKPGWWMINENSRAMLAKHGGWIKHPDEFAAKFICRNHNDLRFYNSMDALLTVIDKLEKEDLSEYSYKWVSGGETRYNFMNLSFTLYNNGVYSAVELELDPDLSISSNHDPKLTWTQNAFKTVVETIEYVKR